MNYSLQERIIVLLKKNPALRNHPDKLIYTIWMYEIDDTQKEMPVVEFMRKVYSREIKVTNPMTINRTRQEIQKQFPELAGDRERRLAKADHIRKHITNTNFNSITHE